MKIKQTKIHFTLSNLRIYISFSRVSWGGEEMIYVGACNSEIPLQPGEESVR